MILQEGKLKACEAELLQEASDADEILKVVRKCKRFFCVYMQIYSLIWAENEDTHVIKEGNGVVCTSTTSNVFTL